LAIIKPFRGITYNSKLIKAPGSIITPPYDVINSEEQERLYRKHPYNVIRLEYGKTYPEDSDTENRYTRAERTFRQWLVNKILMPEQKRSFYFHEQAFQWHGETRTRFGFMAALKLEPYASGQVLPHELTMAGPKADRYQLLKYTRANFSPIFTIFPDAEQKMESYREIVRALPPAFVITDTLGQNHRLWAVQDRDILAGLTAYLAERPVLIADGHHRYETALHYSQKTNLNRLPGAGYILATLVGSTDPGLLMLPAHRILFNLDHDQRRQLEQTIAENFHFLDRGRPRELDREAFIAEIEQLAPESGTFGYITPTRAGLLLPGRSPEITDLPVTILHKGLLNPAMNSDGSNSQARIEYTHEISQAIETVLDQKADAAFLLGSMPVEKILKRARSGLIMPQKSTYFYPKLPGGLVIYHMRDSGDGAILRDSGDGAILSHNREPE